MLPNVTVRAPTSTSDYQPVLTLYYEEEIMGEAFFAGLARYFPNPQQQEKLLLLSQIERCVADAVRPLLDRHGLRPRNDEELHAIGVEDMDRYQDFAWHKFMEEIIRTFPGYMDEFAALENIAPNEDRDLLQPFTRHEVVGIEFAERELRDDPESVDVLKRYIREFPS